MKFTASSGVKTLKSPSQASKMNLQYKEETRGFKAIEIVQEKSKKISVFSKKAQAKDTQHRRTWKGDKLSNTKEGKEHEYGQERWLNG